MTCREYMQNNPNENLSWCKPYRSEDNRVALAVNERGICGLMIDGKELYEGQSDSLWHKVYETVVPEDDRGLYRGYTEEEIVLVHGYLKECGCSDCPYLDICEAMDEDMMPFGDTEVFNYELR